MTARLWPAASLLALLLAGCPSDDNQGDAGSGTEIARVGPADPTGDPKEDPTSPGLEPPVTNDPTDVGGMSGSSAGGSGAGSPPVQPPPGMTVPDPDVDAGPAPSCATAATGTCGASAPCPQASLHCIVVPECAGAVCITTEDACSIHCGTPSCAILESYPEQLRCE